MDIGRKVRELRERFCFTQDELANFLKTSRATVAQMELGNRVIDSVTLENIADFFGCDPQLFLEEDESSIDSIAVLFRANTDLQENTELRKCVIQCRKLGMENRNLHEILQIGSDNLTGASYSLRPPANKWEAMEQGKRIAQQERRRLELGHQPVREIIKLIESQGVLVNQEKMPSDVSGFTLCDKSAGTLIFINSEHPGVRKRFSLVHEYCHAILDTDRAVIVSRFQSNSELLEVRANSFAAHFLVPDELCRAAVHDLGKGYQSREEAVVYNEDKSLELHKRNLRSMQTIQLYDAGGLALWFGVSIETILYRLKNTGFISGDELETLLAEKNGPLGKQLMRILPEHETEAAFRSRDMLKVNIFNMALEAYRRGEISTGKVMEIASLVKVNPDRAFAIITELNSLCLTEKL